MGAGEGDETWKRKRVSGRVWGRRHTSMGHIHGNTCARRLQQCVWCGVVWCSVCGYTT